MLITYYGLSCFKISTKVANGQEKILVTDPFDPQAAGLKLPRLKADVLLVTNNDSIFHNHTRAISSAGEDHLFVIDSPGEYEVKDYFIQGLPSHAGSVIYYLEAEKIKIVFLGSISQSNLTAEQVEVLEDADILIVPIGGGPVLNSKSASQLVAQLEPRLVIPAFYKSPGVRLKGVEDTPENFFKELGVKPELLDKLRVSLKDLPPEELKAIQLRF